MFTNWCAYLLYDHQVMDKSWLTLTCWGHKYVGQINSYIKVQQIFYLTLNAYRWIREWQNSQLEL